MTDYFRMKHPRTGFSLPAVMVCLITVAVIVIGALTQSLKLHRQSRHEIMLEQTRWVLDAGISRAVSALQADRDYTGEKLDLKVPVKEYKPSLKISVIHSEPNQPATVDVVATLVRMDSSPLEIPFQRSLRFQFIPNPNQNPAVKPAN
jgi:Tfp pilus assembly protein PilV